jgi:hypothetical protein
VTRQRPSISSAIRRLRCSARSSHRCAVSLATPTETRTTILRHALEECWHSRFLSQIFIQRYGESWRVPLHESLLSVCGDGKIERGNPKKPFYANDLTPDQYNRAREICTAAEIEDETLLDACTLDVAVLSNETAAAVYTVLLTPIAVMQTGAPIP